MIQLANNRQLFAGIMSGTSLDGIDAVLVEFHDSPTKKPELIAAHSQPFSTDTRKKILALCQSGHDEIRRMTELDIELGTLFSAAIMDLLKKSGTESREITAIGCHGQTIRHHNAQSSRLFSLQIGDPNTIAFQTGITTISDFRRMDIAADGQGAPLVPAFHDAMLRNIEETRAVVNIGGMANITFLAHEYPVIGFDTGPGNVLMDAWTGRHLNKPWDENGSWALQGNINTPLLAEWLQHPYFQQPAPKSTGRETFYIDWAMSYLEKHDTVSAVDVQRTLLELTATTIANSIKTLPAAIDRMLLCGGGSHNLLLRKRISELLPTCSVDDTTAEGIDPDWMEAMAFAWLARQRLERNPGNLPTVTGANKSCILGGIYEPPPT